MEKNLNKYVTLDEAAKQVTITADMVNRLLVTNRIPYFNDKGTIKVFPADVTEAISELIGMDEKKIQQKIKNREKAKELFPPETPPETDASDESTS